MQQPPYGQQDPNSGQQITPGYVVDKSAERTLSAVAHGAIAFGLFGFTLLLSLAISGIIWLYSRRSPEVRFHAEQAGCYQCIVLLVNAIFITILGVSGGFWIWNLLRGNGPGELGAATVLGLILFAVWFFLSIGYGIFAAVMVLLGKRFKYPFIGDRFERKAL